MPLEVIMKPKQKKILNVVITIVVIIGIMVGVYFALKALGITDQNKLHEMINSTGAWAPIVFFLLQLVATTLLVVVPGTNLTFLILAGVLFENVWVAISLALVGVWVSSIIMFAVGDTLGEKIAVKLVGKEDLAKAQDLIDTKSKIYLPIMFLFPFFPDDGLCLAAGMTKMKYSYFIPIVIIFRSVGALATVLTSFYHQNLSELLGIASFTPIQWVVFINVLLFDAYVIFKLTRLIEKRINAKKAKEKLELEKNESVETQLAKEELTEISANDDKKDENS